MPIPVTCPNCSAGFKVKDEYAGKRGKCPKCGSPLTVPTALQTAETMFDPPSVPVDPPTARPASAAPAQPVPAEGGDENPRPSRRPRVVDEGDGEDRPRARRRAQDEEGEDGDRRSSRRRGDEEERPGGRRRRRRDDDDEPKKSSVPLILGILGGVLFVCCGGATAVWFLVIQPGVDNVRKMGSELKQFNEYPRVTVVNLGQIRAGMSLAQVEAVLGKGQKVDAEEVSLLTDELPDPVDAGQRWGAKAGLVYQWANWPDSILIAYSADPATGGTVAGVLAEIDETTTEPVVLPSKGGTTEPTVPPVQPGTPKLKMPGRSGRPTDPGVGGVPGPDGMK